MRWKAVGMSVVAVASLLAVVPGTAFAHTGFDYSDPADGAEVPGPLDEIVVAFTEAVTIVGNGFEVLDPSGSIVDPKVETSDDMVFHLLIDEPLAGGQVGVRYEVSSEDGHVVSGGFSFTVAAVVTTTTTMGSTTTTGSATTTISRAPDTTAPVPATTVTVAAIVEGEDEGSSTPILIVAGAFLLAGGAVYLARRARAQSGQ